MFDSGVDRTPRGAERGGVHRGGEDIRQYIAAGPVVHDDAGAHQETDQRQPRPALSRPSVSVLLRRRRRRRRHRRSLRKTATVLSTIIFPLTTQKLFCLT